VNPDQQSLIPSTKTGWIAVFLAINGFLFFVLAFLFDGGAYPWGEIRGENFFVVTGTSQVEVSRNWFWLTYWQGLFVWVGGACFLVFLVLTNRLPETQRKGWQALMTKVVLTAALSIWLFVAIVSALTTAS